MTKAGERYLAETAPFVEEGIRPLVVALSRRGGIDICFSCEGHPGKEKKPSAPYVTFKFEDGVSKRLELDNIREKLQGTGWGVFYKDRYGLCGLFDAEWRRIPSYTIRPCKGRKSPMTVQDIAERLSVLNPVTRGWVCYRQTVYRKRLNKKGEK